MATKQTHQNPIENRRKAERVAPASCRLPDSDHSLPAGGRRYKRIVGRFCLFCARNWMRLPCITRRSAAYSFTVLRRRALVMTERELKVMATAANFAHKIDK